MKRKDCIAMILAGGQGSRLGALTKKIAKPAVPFGGKYKIIDFALSNCTNSGIFTVGVLTQYQPHELSRYIGSGQPWDMDRYDGGIFILPPYTKEKSGEWYKGTANAIYQNISFVESFDPKDVLILSADHVYIMDYRLMLDAHRARGAHATIAVMPVPWEEASRFGVISADEDGRVTDFAEKPKAPQSNLISMGVYIFGWEMLRKYLIMDEKAEKSSNDFGKNIIPAMLADGAKLYVHRFNSYWKDVGTIESLWQSNMDLLDKPMALDLYDDAKRIYCRNAVKPPHYASASAKVLDSVVTEGCEIDGEVTRSVLSNGVSVGKGSRVIGSVVFPDATIGAGCVVDKAIIGDRAVIEDGCVINCRAEGCALCAANAAYASQYCTNGISLIGPGVTVGAGSHIPPNSMVSRNVAPAAKADAAPPPKAGKRPDAAKADAAKAEAAKAEAAKAEMAQAEMAQAAKADAAPSAEAGKADMAAGKAAKAEAGKAAKAEAEAAKADPQKPGAAAYAAAASQIEAAAYAAAALKAEGVFAAKPATTKQGGAKA